MNLNFLNFYFLTSFSIFKRGYDIIIILSPVVVKSNYLGCNIVNSVEYVPLDYGQRWRVLNPFPNNKHLVIKIPKLSDLKF